MAPRSVEESIETLAKYLAKPANNDIEVVRALYVWICENIRYNTNAFFGGNLSSLDTSGKGVLTSKSSVCAGYANLLESLCQALDITCKHISGYAKGYGHNLGEIITFSQDTDHAWNAVRLEGVWRFIDTTWGAGYVDKNQEFIKKFNNFYFLTSPENFIYDHFPYFNSNIEESKKWQLLEKPISIEEYAKKIKPSKEARQYGIKFSHPDVIIDHSPCTIIVESSAHPFQNCWFDFYNDKGSKCTDAAIMLCADSKECKTTARPQFGGKYTLCLHAKIKDENTTLAEYIINCGTAESNWKPYPNYGGFYGPTLSFTERGFESFCIKPSYTCKDGKFHLSLKTSSTPEVLVQLHDAENIDHKENLMVEQNDTSINIRSRLLTKGYYKLELLSKVDEKYTLASTVLILNTGESDWKPFPKNTGHYGPTPDFTDRGFETSCLKPFYECTDGNFHLSLKTSSTPDVLVYLYDAENVDQKENRTVEQDETSVNIRSRLLNKGYYKLQLFVKVDEVYTLVYTVLILNTGESNWKHFPKNTGHYGPKPDFTDRGFETSCLKPFHECTDGNFYLSLKTTSTPEVLVQLHDAENVDHKENLTVGQDETSVNIRSRLLNKGYYKLQLFGKVDEVYTLVYTVLILNTGKSNWKPFPKNTRHYGPTTSDFTDRGFETSCIKPFYECTDGNFHLSLKTSSTPEVLVKLHDAENIDHKENLMVEQNDTSINIRSRLLTKGYYKLELLSKVDEKYTLVYTVLILNTGKSNWKPFPKNTGHYGPTPDFTDRGFETSCIKPFYECTDGNFHLSLKTTSTPDVLVDLHDAENVDQNEILTVEQDETSVNIRSRLLNKGYYKLQLCGKVDEVYTLVYTVLILNTGKSNWKPFPKNTGHYGPTPDFTDRGFETSCLKPFYECTDGNFHLSLKTSSTPDVLVYLYDAENVDQKENRTVEQDETSVNIRSRLLNKGYYKLQLFVKVDEVYTLVYTGLILNTGESNWKPFPKNTGHYGPKPDFTDRGFETSCLKPFHECTDGNFYLSLKTTSTPEVLVQLHDAENIDHKENLRVGQDETSVNIRSRLLNKGYYKLQLFVKVDEVYPLVYQVLILNTGESNWKPFPKNTGHYGPMPDFTDRGFESSCIKPFYECKDGNFGLFLKTTSTPKILVQLHDAENVDHKENLMVEQNDTSINISSPLFKKGYYKLGLFSKRNENYTLAYTVLILNTGESNWKPFPKNTGHYGPTTSDFTDRGFETSCIKPFYECTDGNFHLSLKTSSTPDFLVYLYDAENVDQNEILTVEQDETSVNIRSRLLNKGYYKLELFGKVDEVYTLVYTVLILNTGKSNWKPFPKNTRHYGPTPDFTDRGFETSCIKPFYECTDGNFHLSLKTTSTPDVLVDLHDAENVDQKEILTVEQDETSVNIRSRLLNKGYYKLQLFGKVDEVYTLVYKVLILNTAESDVKSMFPITYTTTTKY
ncbi:uncharacterized protein LOC134688356 isoform X2 [Mytilus trossulus]|uniref:uncharacterized protein LOC134688356 isoform X2 n=1 Tax=Mytilus trossulus TaxID=6551 RepID=UPI0030045A03